MNNELVNVTEAEIDLLAEGELNNERRTDLFHRLDEHPQQWKWCALAVVETQSLRRSVRASSLERLNKPANPDTMPITNVELENVGSRSRTVAYASQWLVAALLLVGLTVGAFRMGRQSASRPMASPGVASADVRSLIGATESTLNRLNIGDEEVLAFVKVNSGKRPVVVPVVNSQKLADQALRLPMAPLPQEQIRRANEKGWNVSQERILIATEFLTAETEIVPVQMVRYQFVGKDVL